MPDILSNYTANMPGFNGPTGYSSNTGTDPFQGMPAANGGAMSPVLGGSGMGDPYASAHRGGLMPPQQPQQPQLPSPPPAQTPQITMPPPPPMMPQSSPNPNASTMPNPGPSTSAMNQALMNQLGTGAIGMQKPSPLVSQNAAQVGTGAFNYSPLFGA